ncbi:hypothetical protein PHET_03738 [Paragonimus heterotremus]|uniref:Uncharacterized protein n=1 Tax=Paragonimus heterotremus TaxID=100268 RepID=A0A8J4SNS2_9TREM|nr:hypothetical protein PHET_03738 [Paragonimus heterotremus]
MSMENGSYLQNCAEGSSEYPKDMCIISSNSETSSNSFNTSGSVKGFQDCNAELAKILETRDDCRLTNFAEMSKQLLCVRKELFGAVSNTERAEANRQAVELELTRVNLINKKLHFTCCQQQKLLDDTQAELVRLKKVYETEVNKTNFVHKTAHDDWLQKQSRFEDKMETMTNDLESLKNALTCSQSQLMLVTKEKNQLLQTTDRLTAQLNSLIEEKQEMNAILDAKLNDEVAIKADYTNLLEQHQTLQKRSQLNEQQLSHLNGELPAIVQTALIEAVNSVRDVAEEQLRNAHNRLEIAEKRLEVQAKQLRCLDLASSSLNGRLATPLLNCTVRSCGDSGQTQTTLHCHLDFPKDKHYAEPPKTKEKTQRTEDIKRWFYCQLVEMLSLLDENEFIQKLESNSIQSARTENEAKRQSRTRFHIPAPPWRESCEARELTNSRRRTPGRPEVIPSPVIQKTITTVTWSHIGEIISKIHRQLSSGRSTNHVNVDRLRTLETDNQVLRRKLLQLRSKFDRTRTSQATGAISHSPTGRNTSTACSTRCTNPPCHNSRSGLRSGSREQLEARCFRALKEASRWRQRFKQQAVTLRAEQERLAVMQVNQQSDYRLRDKFLHSVCQLITEASRQIDRVVQKHISRLNSTAPVDDAEGHTHRLHGSWFRTENRSTDHSGERVQYDESVYSPSCTNLSASDELRIRPKVHPRDHRLRNFTNATGDGDGVRLTGHEQWSSDSYNGQMSDAVHSPHHSRTQEEYAIHGHTNCNNNVGASRSPPLVIVTPLDARTHTTAKTVSSPSSPQQTRSRVDSPPTKSGSQLTGWSDAVGAKDENSDCSHSPIVSISTTLDPFDHEDSSTCEALDQSTAITRQRIGETGETEQSAITVVTKPDFPATGASHSDPISVRRGGVRNEGDLNRWLELRAAVRFELGRVIANVLRHAQRNDSLAQDCLEAIAELQAELTEVPPHDMEKETNTTVDVQPHLAEQNFQTPQWSSATGEGRHCDGGLPHYLSTSNQLARRDSHSVDRDISTSLSAIQIVTIPVDVDREKSPSVRAFRPWCIPTPMPTATPTHTPEQLPSLDPVPKSTSVSSTQSTTKKLTRTRHSVERAKWKPVGGVIRPLVTRNPPPLLTQSRGITRRQPVHSIRSSMVGQKLSDASGSMPGNLPSLNGRLHSVGNTSPRNSINDPVGTSSGPKSNDPELAGGGGATTVDLSSDQPDCERLLPPLTSSQCTSCDALLPGQRRPMSNRSSETNDLVSRKLRGSVLPSTLESDNSALLVGPNIEQAVKQPFRKWGSYVKRMRGELTHADHSTRHLDVLQVNQTTKPLAPDTTGLPPNSDSGQVMQSNVNHHTKASALLPLRPPLQRSYFHPTALNNSRGHMPSDSCCCGSSCCIIYLDDEKL